MKHTSALEPKPHFANNPATELRNQAVDDLLSDPIVQLVMRRDGIDEDTVRRFIQDSARRLRKPPVAR